MTIGGLIRIGVFFIAGWGTCGQDGGAGYREILLETESFTHFLATEKLSIRPEKRDAFQYWIAGYFQRLHGNEKVQHPGAQLRGLMEGVRKNGFLISKEKEVAFELVAWLAGMELIKDRRCFQPDLENVTVEEGVIYASRNGYPLRCDLYQPKLAAGKVPVILCIHGGGFRVHRRAWFGGHAGYFAGRGYAAVAIDYRKEPGTRSVLESVEDAKAAVRWIRTHADKYGWDADKIGAVGGSAGAYLTAILATTGDESQLEGPAEGAALLMVSSRIQAAVGFATGVRNMQLEDVPPHELAKFPADLDLRLMSLYWSADKDSAPFFFDPWNRGQSGQFAKFQRSARKIPAKRGEIGAEITQR